MDLALKKAIQAHIPPVNDKVINGLAVHELQYVKEYVNNLLHCAKENFPLGLSYEGMETLSPVDEYFQVTKEYANKHRFDNARNDVFMVMLKFSFEGNPIDKPLFLPFVRDGGMICIKGASFYISPILSDKGISYGTDSAFIQIPKARIVVKPLRHHFLANGQRKTPLIVYSWLHNRDRNKRDSNSRPPLAMKTTFIHYLFAKYGIKETFARFNNTKIHVGTTEEITPQTHPSDQWVICTTIGRQPKGYPEKTYSPCRVAIAIRSVDYDYIAESMIGAFFYIADFFPQRLFASYLDGSDDEIRLWRILLGLIIGGITGGEGCVKEAVDEHMDSLDSYIDAGAKSMLEEGDIYVNDVYELLYVVLENISQMMLKSSEVISSMYGKQFLILRPVMRDVNESINRMIFLLKKTALNKTLTFNDVEKIIKRKLPTDIVLRMNNPSKHPEIASVSSPGDNKFFKITSHLVLQSDSNKKKNAKGAKPVHTDKTKLLHASIAEVGSYIALSKNEVTGRGKINPWVCVSDNGTVLKNPELSDVIDRTQAIIQRKD